MEVTWICLQRSVQKGSLLFIKHLLNNFLKVQDTTRTSVRTESYVQEWHITKYQLISSTPR